MQHYAYHSGWNAKIDGKMPLGSSVIVVTGYGNIPSPMLSDISLYFAFQMDLKVVNNVQIAVQMICS